MYQTGGLAEIVRNPSKITKSYLDIWFTGNSSLGKALELLKWPITKDDAPLLVVHNGFLHVDLSALEKVMYSKTALHYVKEKNEYVLKVDPVKLLSPRHLLGTARAIWSQSKLLINYQRTYDDARNYIESIPLAIPPDKNEIENNLKENVWPYLIAVDYMGEFVYSALVDKLSEERKSELLMKLHKKISPDDWYTQAILAWSDLEEKQILMKEFKPIYGFAAGDDYELKRPRYYELLRIPKPQITRVEIEDRKITSLADLYVGLQYLRSIGKLKSLIWISALRDVLFTKTR